MRYDQSTLDSYRQERQWLMERLKVVEIWVNEQQPNAIGIRSGIRGVIGSLEQGIRRLEAKHAK